MKILGLQRPSREQLRIISEKNPGTEIIRGAAGSGKTTTALLRLRNLSEMFRAHHRRLGIERPVRVLVLTYNRTLCGYVKALARERATVGVDLEVEVDTFAHWALEKLGSPEILGKRGPIISRLAALQNIRLASDFVCSEIEYILGRFPSENLNSYLEAERTGRGATPRVERPLRQSLLALIASYKLELAKTKKLDWEDLPAEMLKLASLEYDIAIIDEAQDFSANQLRAVLHHLAPERALTLIIDTMQRLYPRGYTWAEAGIRQARFHRLEENHRNSVEIARFAKGILSGLSLDDDGTLPNLDRATRHGPIPEVIKGQYHAQLDFAVRHIRGNVDLSKESVAFLKPKGGRWFDAIRGRLSHERLSFDEITRERDWPDGPENIALCTMHSAKGLEFDHVIILGLSAEVTQHGEAADDDQLVTLRRLLAMAVARARQTVIVGYKPSEASDLIKYFEKGTYTETTL